MASLLKSTLNTRFIIANGKNTCTIRSELLDNCPKEDVQTLKDLGILAVVDLRRLQGETINPYLSELGIQYFNVPIDDVDFDLSKFIDATGAGDDPNLRNVAVGDFYYYAMKDLYRKEMIKVLKIYNQFDGHILIHCTYGKDRTGMIAYLIQRHLGATEEEMLSDYIASSINLEPMFLDRVHRTTPEKARAIWDRCFALCKPEMHEIFDEFDRILKEKIV